jgi:hypothetical protein
MDPWLEDFEFWPDFHKSLIVSIRDYLSPMVRPRYFVGVNSRMVVLNAAEEDRIERPDAPVSDAEPEPSSHQDGRVVPDCVVTTPRRGSNRRPSARIEEIFLVITERTERRVVTVVEVLSPTNKKTKPARERYLKRRHELMDSDVNLIEIDLLRAGKRMPLSDGPPRSDYRILVYRSRPIRLAEVRPFTYKDSIPPISIPLVPGEDEPTIDLNSIVHGLIDRVRYDLRLDYSQPPHPPLRPGDQAWAAAIVAQVPIEQPVVPARGEPSP